MKYCSFLLFIVLFFTNFVKGQTFDSDFRNWQILTEQVYEVYNEHTFEESRSFRNQVYSKLGEEYYNFYLKTGNETFFALALNELGLSDRMFILQNKPEFNELIEAHIDRRVDNTYSETLLKQRDFILLDIYLFQFVEVRKTDVSAIRNLLNYWISVLPEVYNREPLKAALMILIITDGFYTIGKTAPIAELIPYSSELINLPASHILNSLTSIFAYEIQQNKYYTQALKLFRDVRIPLSEKIHDTEIQLHTRIDYGTLLFQLGYFNEAVQELEYAYNHPYQLTNERYISALSNNLAVSYLNTGDFNKYVNFQLDAYYNSIETDNKVYQLSILRNLFIFHRRQNEHEQALAYLTEALDIARESNLINELPAILISLANYHKNVTGELDRAVDILFEAISTAKLVNNDRTAFNAELALADLYIFMEDFEKAISLFSDILDQDAGSLSEKPLVEILIRKAHAYFESGNILRAQELMDDISTEDLDRLFFRDKVFAYTLQNRLRIEQNNELAALESVRELLPQILEWLQESANVQTGLMRLDEEFVEAFALATKILTNTGFTQEAIQLQEDIRNVSKSGFFNNPLLKTRQMTDNELDEDYILGNRIQRLRRELQNANENEKVRIQNQLLDATNRKNQLLSRSFQTARFDNENVDFTAIQKKLDSSQVVLYLNRFNETLYIFSISRDQIQTESVSFTALDEDRISAALDLLATGKTDIQELYHIYSTFFESSLSHDFRHIYIVPDGIFYRLPFEVLPVEQPHSAFSYGSATYLLERSSVSYLNSLSDLVQSKNSTESQTYDFAGFGVSDFSHIEEKNLNLLPYATAEVEAATTALSRFSSNRVLVKNEDEAHEVNFRKVAGNSSIVHLATHSEISEDNPLFSVIYLNADNDSTGFASDGYMHAYELFEMNLTSKLMMLSSCNSGSGAFIRGAGILGFSRALHYAGAESMAMNIWPVRDLTASEISTSFYTFLNQGYTKPEALRLARLEYLNNVNSNPFLWGSMVIYGDTSPIVNTNSFMFWLILSSFSGSILLIAFYFYRKYNEGYNTIDE